MFANFMIYKEVFGRVLNPGWQPAPRRVFGVMYGAGPISLNVLCSFFPGINELDCQPCEVPGIACDQGQVML